MTESNVLLYGFIAVSVLLIALCIVATIYILQAQRRVCILEEYAAKLLDEKNVLTLENKRLTGEECRRAVEDFLKRVEAKFQEPNA